MAGASRAGDDVRVSQSAEQALAEVIIDVNPLSPSNIALCGYARSLKAISTFHTFDGGVTWTYLPVGDAQDGLGADIDRYDPTLVFDASGFLYVGYGARVPDGTGFLDHLVVCRSDDGGATFRPATTVWTARNVVGNAGNDKFHLAAGPVRFDRDHSVLMMVWTWNIPPPLGSVDQQIVFSRSVDAGATFSPPVVINDDSISDRDFATFADPAIGPEGILYVAWNDLNTNEILVDHSFDNGATWGIDVVVQEGALPFRTRIPPQPNRGVFAGPVLDTDAGDGPHRGRLYLVYCGGSEQDTDVFVRYSDDKANTFSPAVRVNNDPPGSFQFLPWIDVDQTSGRVNVVFYDTREDPVNHRARVHIAASDTGGDSFLPNAAVADVPSNNGASNRNRYPGNYLEYIGVTSWNNEALVVWTDTRNAPTPLTDYYFDRVTDPSPPQIHVALDRTVLWPPDGRWVTVRASVTVHDVQDPAPAWFLESVESDEPGVSDEDVKGAVFGTADLEFALRAEWNGRGRERVYRIVYAAVDAGGNAARDTARVTVPLEYQDDDVTAVNGRAPGGGIRAIQPNPANPSTLIRFDVSVSGQVRLSVRDVHGELIATLREGTMSAGTHLREWDGRNQRGGNVASGVYFVVLEAPGVRDVRKLMILR